MRIWSCLLALGLLQGAAREAHADDERNRCLAAYEQGQQRRKESRVLEARAELAVCSRDTCPELARRDCVAWLRELDAAVPSVVVAARTRSGADVLDAELTVDGRAAPSSLTGAPLELDPGAHRLGLRAPGGRATEQTILVKLAEKNRLIVLTLEDSPRTAPAAPAAPAAPPEKSRAVSPLPWVMGGIGVALLATGTVLDLVGSAELRDLRSECAPDCSVPDVGATRTMIIAGDAMLVGGGVTLVVAIYLALRRPTTATAFTGRLSW